MCACVKPKDFQYHSTIARTQFLTAICKIYDLLLQMAFVCVCGETKYFIDSGFDCIKIVPTENGRSYLVMAQKEQAKTTMYDDAS